MTIQYPTPIATAMQCASVNSLFQALNLRSPISFLQSATPGWTCKTMGGHTEIEYSHSQRPTEALAHELLHTELKLDGYKQHLTLLPKISGPVAPIVMELLSILDNELQHHRMCPRFAELGLDPEFFYDDADVNSIKRVRRSAEKLKLNGHISEFLRLYVTLIAPGGRGSNIERSQAKVFLMNRGSQRTRRKLEAIENLFMTWSAADNLDVAPTLRQILEIVGVELEYWVGHDTTFPGNGFFVGTPFQLSAVVA